MEKRLLFRLRSYILCAFCQHCNIYGDADIAKHHGPLQCIRIFFARCVDDNHLYSYYFFACDLQLTSLFSVFSFPSICVTFWLISLCLVCRLLLFLFLFLFCLALIFGFTYKWFCTKLYFYVLWSVLFFILMANFFATPKHSTQYWSSASWDILWARLHLVNHFCREKCQTNTVIVKRHIAAISKCSQ